MFISMKPIKDFRKPFLSLQIVHVANNNSQIYYIPTQEFFLSTHLFNYFYVPLRQFHAKTPWNMLILQLLKVIVIFQ